MKTKIIFLYYPLCAPSAAACSCGKLVVFRVGEAYDVRAPKV